jgi:hypothetical protein
LCDLILVYLIILYFFEESFYSFCNSLPSILPNVLYFFVPTRLWLDRMDSKTFIKSSKSNLSYLC